MTAGPNETCASEQMVRLDYVMLMFFKLNPSTEVSFLMLEEN